MLGDALHLLESFGPDLIEERLERVLVEHPAVSDALVVGLPHPRFGKMVVAVVEGPGLTADNLEADVIAAHAARHLADYKVPRKIFAIDSLQRAPNGKPDYAFVTAYAQNCADA